MRKVRDFKYNPHLVEVIQIRDKFARICMDISEQTCVDITGLG